jgi:hypothetical protein
VAYSGTITPQVITCMDSSSHGFFVELYDGGWYVGWKESGGDYRENITATSASYPQNAWVFLAATVTPSQTSFFTNGVLMKMTAESPNLGAAGIGPATAGGLTIGAQDPSGSATFLLTGDVSLVQIYGVALGSNQIASKCYWTGGSPGNGTCRPTGP